MSEPMYQRIANDLRDLIESGRIRPGEPLPTEVKLRDRYNASRNTVRDAIKRLTHQGLVETKPGIGTFVTRRIDPLVTTLSVSTRTGLAGWEGDGAIADTVARGRVPRATTPRVEVLAATDDIAALLAVAAGTSVINRHQDCFVDGMPWWQQATWCPMTLVDGGASGLLKAEVIEDLGDYLGRAVGRRPVGDTVRFASRLPVGSETRFFDLPENGHVPVYSLTHIVYTDSEAGPVPLWATVAVYPADRNQVEINSGKVPQQRWAPAMVPQ